MLVRTALILALLASLSVAPAGAAPGEHGPPSRALSTPQLLDRAVERGRLNRAQADLYLAFALGDHRRLPDRFVSDAPWDGTLPLLRLNERVERMPPGPIRAAISEALNAGSCGGVSGGANTVTTPHYFIEYGTIQAGLTISQYSASLEDSWTTEVNAFGWASPPLPSTTPTPSRYHVVIANLGPGLYGFVSPSGTHAGFVGDNANTAWNEGDAFASCMALNRNYNGFPSPPQASLDATTAHEFNHSIQFGLGAITGPNAADDAFVEGGATWMEDEVFDGADDNYNYLWPDFTMSMGEYPAFPLPDPYSYWVVFRALTERYGAGVSGRGEEVMQKFWEAVSQSPTSIDLDALNAALVSKGTTLADAYHAGAVALKFNQGCGLALAVPYCLDEGPGYVADSGPTPVHGSIGSVGESRSGFVSDNYALNWVTLPASGPYDVTLQNTSPAGQLRGTVACSDGAGLSLFPLPAVVGAGASTTLVGFHPAGAGCSGASGAPVAVITNQSQTAPNPSSSTERSYDLSTAAVSEASHPLGVTLAGSGSGTVTSDPAGIGCPDDCTENYDDMSMVTLTATAEPGSAFQGWLGACSGTSLSCPVNMTTATSVTAIFEDQSHDLTVAVSGSGTVTSSPAGISCPGDCYQDYADGTAVTLTATPVAGSTFSMWSGNCVGPAPMCNLTMSGDRSVTAIFGPPPEPIPKTVKLKARPQTVDRGDRTKLRAKVLPCPGHEGDVIQFFRKKKKVATRKSNGSCVAKVKVKVRRTSRFRAVSPQQDDDHLKGTSRKVKVRVRRA